MTIPAFENCERQAKACAALGSPFTATVCQLLPTLLTTENAFGRRFIAWPETAHDDALALRACGGLHRLARSGTCPELSAAYPPHDASPEQVRDGLLAAITKHADFLADYLSSPPQTNEVARSAILLGGLLTIARETRLPLELIEIGSSAGLNLFVDAYDYALGGDRRWGSADAPLTIASDWSGSLPPLAQTLDVVRRVGCDRNPLNPADPETRERLLGYVWPDQPARMQRLSAALDFVASTDMRVEATDAAAFVERELARPQASGTVRVVMHTVVWQYLPQEARNRITVALNKAGALAEPDRPLAHLSVEADGASDAAVTLELWPRDERRELGRADFHGRWVRWA